MVCVPLILFSGFALVGQFYKSFVLCYIGIINRHCIQAANSGTLIPLPNILTIPHLDLNLGTIAAFIWGGLYVLLEPVAGTALGLICIGAAAVTNTPYHIIPL